MNGEQKLISLAVLVLGLVLVALACTPKQEQQAIGILNAIDRGCVVVQQIHDPEGRVTDACVSVDDVREAVEALLKARASVAKLATGKASASASASAAPAGSVTP